MKPLDYGSSYICFTGPDNAVRFWIESRTRIVDGEHGRTEDYYQCGACKSEHTWTTSKPGRFLFSEDNHDFTPVFGPDYSVIFRAPWKGAVSQRVRIPPGNCRSSRKQSERCREVTNCTEALR